MSVYKVTRMKCLSSHIAIVFCLDTGSNLAQDGLSKYDLDLLPTPPTFNDYRHMCDYTQFTKC